VVSLKSLQNWRGWTSHFGEDGQEHQFANGEAEGGQAETL